MLFVAEYHSATTHYLILHANILMFCSLKNLALASKTILHLINIFSKEIIYVIISIYFSTTVGTQHHDNRLISLP